MKKHVEIMCGDEYRAKIENRIESGSIFEDVCVRANEILYEIISENDNYSGENFHGMGNNVIAFCGKRGQGKTSAMQSYSAFLREEVSVEKNNENFQNLAMDKIKKCRFKVLDSIDPAALRSGESIVRVLISRIFTDFDKFVDGEKTPIGKEESFKISKLFQKCFSNVDYLERSNDKEDNDLDSLARLGNSSELRKNLNELIEMYFDIIYKNSKDTYLIVQIDDADLSMSNAYKVCDNIHMYFSVPKVIVLMATDYEQLGYAIKQNYMDQYKILLKYDDNFKEGEECEKMASRYLEKILPNGHIIWLPDLNEFISSNSRKLTISYKDRDKNELLSDDINKLSSFQEQLLRLLYEKTGIVLLLDENGQHPFIPETLRELTHTIKLLVDMKDIDFNKAYLFATIEEDFSEDLKSKCKDESLKEFYNIRDNIKKIKRFLSAGLVLDPPRIFTI